MEINVLIEEGIEGCPDADWLRSVVEQVLLAQAVSDASEVGLVITGQERIRELNQAYRGIDEPTDVLSFCMSPESIQGEESTPFVQAPDGIQHLGEVIISSPQAAIQAKEHRHSLKREIAILIVHGVLHLLGYDHVEPDQAKEMKAKERGILQKALEKIDFT